MSKKASPLDIMNLMGKAAQQKSNAMGGQPEDEEDPLNSHSPKSKKSPANPRSKQVAAIKGQQKVQGKVLPPKKPESEM